MYCYLIAKIEIIDEDTQEEFQTGFLHPDGTWNPDLEFPDRFKAGARIHYLNGGNEYELKQINIVLYELLEQFHKIAYDINRMTNAIEGK